MLVAVGFAVFGLAVRYLPLFPEVEEPELLAPAAAREPVPAYAPATVGS